MAGVDLFFVLSGYLVSSLLFKEFERTDAVKPIRFLIRRGFKIYPLFYTALLMTLILRFFNGEATPLINFISEFVFLQNYFSGLWNHTWSLAIEEHFYFGLSLFIFLFVKSHLLKRFWPVVLSILFVSVTCLGLRIFNNLSSDYSHLSHLFPTHLRIDSLIFGVLVSYLRLKKPSEFKAFFEKHEKIMYLISLVLILPSFFLSVDTFFMNTVGLTMLYIAFGIILSVFISKDNVFESIQGVIGGVIANSIAKIGLYSYGIYLFHMFVKRYFLGWLTEQGADLSNTMSLLVYFGFSVFFGIIMTRLIEFPFLKLRDRLVPRG